MSVTCLDAGSSPASSTNQNEATRLPKGERVFLFSSVATEHRKTQVVQDDIFLFHVSKDFSITCHLSHNTDQMRLIVSGMGNRLSGITNTEYFGIFFDQGILNSLLSKIVLALSHILCGLLVQTIGFVNGLKRYFSVRIHEVSRLDVSHLAVGQYHLYLQYENGNSFNQAFLISRYIRGLAPILCMFR